MKRMPIINRLKHRAVGKELMDDFETGGDELHEALKHLRRLNRIFGAAAPARYGFKQLWQLAGRPKKLSIMDIGAGSGDVNRDILRWASQEGIDIHLTLIDITEEACFEARRLYHGESQVTVKQGDLFSLEEECTDMIMASQFLHHFDDEQLPGVVMQMLKASRLGVVVSDIHRHSISWIAVWIISRLISNNAYIRHDAPLSVAKGFKSSDWIKLKESLHRIGEDMNLHFSWMPLFRYAVVIPKTEPNEANSNGAWHHN